MQQSAINIKFHFIWGKVYSKIAIGIFKKSNEYIHKSEFTGMIKLQGKNVELSSMCVVVIRTSFPFILCPSLYRMNA